MRSSSGGIGGGSRHWSRRLWCGLLAGSLAVAIAVGALPGAAHADDGGTVRAWGDNSSGQTAVPVAAQSGVVQVAAGYYHSLALTGDGSVVAWGDNTYGQTTVPVAATTGVVQVAPGFAHNLALKGDGSVVAWGWNDFGQTDVPVAAQSDVVQVGAGAAHSLAVKADGSVVAWGWNENGQTDAPVAASSGVVRVAAGYAHSLAVKADGSVVAWGWNLYGQTTVPVAASSGVVQVAAGYYHSLAVKADGSVVAWGDNTYGQADVPVAASSGVVRVAAGAAHSMAVKVDGTVVGWGYNEYGQATVPTDLADVVQVSGGWGHSMAVVGRASVGFNEVTLSGLENAGGVDLVVTRAGNTGISAGVDYAVSSGTAVAGEDFTLSAGTLAFAADETSATIPVAIVNDTVPEGPETIVVSLTDPGAGTALGTPVSMTVTIEASDQQPDALVSTTASTGYVGNNVYNTTGTDQTKKLNARRTQTRTFYMRVANDGTITNTFTVRGSAAKPGSRVRYYQGSTDITKNMLSDDGRPMTLASGASKTIKMKTEILRTARIGSPKPGSVTATWTGDGTRTDLVKGIVRVTR